MMESLDAVPLYARLSQVLTAFTIEFDNECERRIPHSTSNFGSTGLWRTEAPWLLSMAFWLHFLRHVSDGGVALEEFGKATVRSKGELKRWVTRLSKWWGYVVVDKEMVRPTPGGLRALRVWRSLTAEIEARWQERFGGDSVEALRNRLLEAVAERDLPDVLPILGPELMSRGAIPQPVALENRSLPGLLAKVLFAFADEFERGSDVSMAVAVNGMRLGIGAGVSKEAAALLRKRMLNTEKAGECLARLATQDERLDAPLRGTLETIVQHARFTEGLIPCSECWRAKVKRELVLPWFPMILHRGGFPDGA